MLCCFFVLYLLLTFIYTPSVAYVADSHRASSQAAYRYAIIVDAGSSGSRLFVYCIPLIESTTRSLPSVTLCTDDKGEPLTKKVNPGLSSFSSDPSSSGVYISSLVSIAAKHIPKKYHSVTPIYILATAGMRLLSESQQSDIWNAVREAIKNDFDFKFEESWMQTVSGYYEALYGWITVNYLLDNFVDPPKPSVGMLDMGGASMQIAYEVPSEAQVLEDHIMRFTIGGKNTYNVYVMTFLGYGTHAAKSRYKLFLLHNAMEYSPYSSILKSRFRPSTGYTKPPKLPELGVQLLYTTSGKEKFILTDPCLQSGLEDVLTSQDRVFSRTLSTGGTNSPIITFIGAGNLTQCLAYQKFLLQKHKPCRIEPCSMNGVHQPPVDFEGTQFYAMSEYWYTSSDLGTAPADVYSFDSFYNSTENMCKKPWIDALFEYRTQNVDPFNIVNKQAVCFKASWIMNVLHTGFGFSQSYSNVHPIDSLSGIEVQWSLGALVYYMQLPEFQALLSQEPVDAQIGFSDSQKVAVIILFLAFGCPTAVGYCVYRKRRRQQFSPGGCLGGSFCPPIFTRSKCFWRSPKVVTSGVTTGGCKNNPRAAGNNYHYSMIPSPSAVLNFRTSNSLPSFQIIQANDNKCSGHGTI
uniref:Apyrase n=1 Tax=Mesocestoides corti TaxID=53468 RepID=A0A5K3EVA9_MESCO